MKPALLVMAAGLGSRYGSLKQIEPVGPGSETILDYSIYDAARAGFGRVVFVTNPETEIRIRNTIGEKRTGVKLGYLPQEMTMLPEGFGLPDTRGKPWGTGHATLVAEGAIDEPFAVINADDLYGPDAYRLMADALGKLDPDGSEYAMIGFPLRETLSAHGPVARSICSRDRSGNLLGTVELEAVTRQGDGGCSRDHDGSTRFVSGDEIVSMNFWGFTPTIFVHLREQFTAFLGGTEGDAEFYLPATVDRLISLGRARVGVLEGKGPWYGLTHPGDRPGVVEGIRSLVERGVYPEKLWG